MLCLIIFVGKTIRNDSRELTDNDNCEGVRCSRGRCVHLREVCDGVTQCEDGKDEFDESCSFKKDTCDIDPYHTGCGKPGYQI